MPRSLKEILENADELAARFEGDFEGVEVPIAEHRLRLAALARAQAERKLAEAVVEAREDGVSWSKIGKALGTSTQAAQTRYKDVKVGTRSSERLLVAVAKPGRATSASGRVVRDSATGKLRKSTKGGRGGSSSTLTGSVAAKAGPKVRDKRG